MCIFTRDCNDAANAFGNATLLEDDQVLDVACFLDMCSSAEFDTDFSPLFFLYILEEVVDLDTNGHNANRVGIDLTEHGADPFYFSSYGKRNIFRVDPTVLPDVASGYIF